MSETRRRQLNKITKINIERHYQTGHRHHRSQIDDSFTIRSNGSSKKPPLLSSSTSSLLGNIIRTNSSSIPAADCNRMEPSCASRGDKMGPLTETRTKRNTIRTIRSSSKLAFVYTQQQKPQSYSISIVLSLVLIVSSLALVLVLFTTTQVQALNCYTCSSADNPACDEAFTGRANITDTDCERHIGRPAKVCRKLIQYIENKKVVIRSCGYIDEHEEKDRKPMCYKRSGTFALMMESCICYEDNCNHSASLVPNQSVLLLLSGFSVALMLMGNYMVGRRNH